MSEKHSLEPLCCNTVLMNCSYTAILIARFKTLNIEHCFNHSNVIIQMEIWIALVLNTNFDTVLSSSALVKIMQIRNVLVRYEQTLTARRYDLRFTTQSSLSWNKFSNDWKIPLLLCFVQEVAFRVFCRCFKGSHWKKSCRVSYQPLSLKKKDCNSV